MNQSVLTPSANKVSKRKSYSGIDQLINDVLFGTDATLANNVHAVKPAANIIEREKEVLIELAVPGIRKEDIQLQLKKSQLSVSSMPKNESSDSEKKFIKRGFNFSRFERTFSLSEEIDSEKIEAKYVNGILIIHLAKKENMGPKQIMVR